MARDADAVALRNSWSAMMAQIKRRDELLGMIQGKLPEHADDVQAFADADCESWKDGWAAVNTSIATFTACRVLSRTDDDEDTLSSKCQTALDTIKALEKKTWGNAIAQSPHGVEIENI